MKKNNRNAPEQPKSKKSSPTHLRATLLFYLCVCAWFFLANYLTGTIMALNWSGLAIYMPVLFGLFYLGYLLALKLFYQFGYHPRPDPIELGGYRATLSLPVFIAVTPKFATLHRAISRRARFLQLLFNLIKLIFLLALIYEVGYFLQHLTNYIQIGFLAVVAVLIFTVNPILTWFFKRLFQLDIVAKEYGRPLFNDKSSRI